MKKILSLILILTMILSVSSVAMAEVTLEGSGTADAPYLVDTEEELIAAANAGGYIRLTGDFAVVNSVTVKGTVVLDLYGQTITGTDNTSANFGLLNLLADADLTVKDSEGDGKMTLVATTNRGWGSLSAVIQNNQGKVTIEGGTLEHKGGTDMAYGIDNLTNGAGTYAETVINGGTIKSTYRAIRQFLNGTGAQNILKVNGGTIEGANKSIWMQDPNTGANSGTLIVSEKAKLKGDVYLYVTPDSTEWPVSVSIDADALDGESTVTTGNVPGDKKVDLNGGYWGITDVGSTSPSVAVIKGTGYPSLAEAVAAAQNGDTITLLTDSEGDGIVIDKSITIDFAGHTYTVSGELVGSAGTETNGFQILQGKKVTLKNGTLTSSETAHKPTDDSTPCRILVQNYADLTLKDMVLDGSKCKKDLYTLSNNSGEVTIEYTEIIAPTNGFAFDVYDYSSAGYEVPEVTVKGNSNITGKIEKSKAATLEIESGYFSKDPSEYVVDKALVAEVTDGNDNIYAVGEDAIEGIAEAAAAANADITITVTRGSGELELPEGTTVKVDEGVAGSVIVNGKTLKAGETYTVPAKKSGNGIKVKYEGGNSFSTSKSAVPTSVEIDGVPVPFSGDGKFFTVGCIDSDAQWVTVRWNSTSVTTNFNPDVTVSCPNLGIPKTGDMSVWAAIAEFLGF